MPRKSNIVTLLSPSSSQASQPLVAASLSVTRARALLELLEELADSGTLKIDGACNADVLVTTLSTIRGLMQDAEQSIDREAQAAIDRSRPARAEHGRQP